MLLTVGAVVLGLVIGLSLRPRSTRFARPRVRLPGLLVAGVAGQVLAARLSANDAVVVAIVSFAGLVAFSLTNLHLTGMGVMTIGLGVNLFAITANGGMPVSPRALVIADVVPAADVAHVELRGARHLERSGDAITALGDIIPVGRQVVSFGDLIIAVAAADVIAHLARRQRRRQVSISSISPDHDWGMAPRPVPSSASQYSASPEAEAPRTLASATSAPASHNR
ncbi:MAG: hypothetical protein QOH79_3654 [Acidimicrobiaceae bacterium]